MEMRHCTSREMLGLITQDILRPGSWVTTAHVEHLSRDQRVTALELEHKRKGECACRVSIDPSNLDVPREGSLTSSGYSQFRTRKPINIIEASCECESETPWGLIFCGLLLGGLLLHSQHQHH